jgi:hypothetical protein
MKTNAKIHRLVTAIVVAFVTLGWVAHQACATTMKITYTGAVAPVGGQTQLIDRTGVFGDPGTDLAGLDYTLVYTIDSSAGSYSTFNGTFSDPQLSGDQVFGGISADLTINGHTFAYTGVGSPPGNFDIVATKPGLGEFNQQFSLDSTPAEVSVGLRYDNPGPGFPTSVLTPFTLTDCPAASCSFSGFFYTPAKTVPNSGPLFGNLAFGSVSATVAPLPPTLPLMISALGGLGFLGWRRRSRQRALTPGAFVRDR